MNSLGKGVDFESAVSLLSCISKIKLQSAVWDGTDFGTAVWIRWHDVIGKGIVAFGSVSVVFAVSSSYYLFVPPSCNCRLFCNRGSSIYFNFSFFEKATVRLVAID